MKKVLIKSLVLAALTALCLTATAAAAEIGTGVVDADALRLRTEPSTDSSTITYLNSGTTVTVQEDLGEWYKITAGSNTGYVSAEFVIYSPASTEIAEEDVPETAAPADITGEINAIDVNLRSGPSTDYAVAAILSEGDPVTLLATADGWCQVAWNGQVGYVSAEFVSVNGVPQNVTQGKVTGTCVNVRSGPSTDSSIVTKVYAGKVVDLLCLENNWYSVSCDGTKGYIRSDYIRPYDGSGPASSSIGDDIAALALEYLGTPYAYGGASPKGFDCSGFTMYIFSLKGYSLPHSATSQWNSIGEYVDRSDLQPGDLVLFCDPARSNGKACSHVGIYIGDNEFVHASSGSSGKQVRISSLSEDYYNGYYKGAKRVG